MPVFASLYTSCCVLLLLAASAANAAVPDAATVAAAEKQFAETLAKDHGLNEADVLATLSCDQMQGYFFSRPRPRDEITPLLQKRP